MSSIRLSDVWGSARQKSGHRLKHVEPESRHTEKPPFITIEKYAKLCWRLSIVHMPIS